MIIIADKNPSGEPGRRVPAAARRRLPGWLQLGTYCRITQVLNKPSRQRPLST